MKWAVVCRSSTATCFSQAHLYWTRIAQCLSTSTAAASSDRSPINNNAQTVRVETAIDEKLGRKRIEHVSADVSFANTDDFRTASSRTSSYLSAAIDGAATLHNCVHAGAASVWFRCGGGQGRKPRHHGNNCLPCAGFNRPVLLNLFSDILPFYQTRLPDLPPIH